MIKFLCPNGHQLTAPDNLAGKTGKCPKCSSAFVVPTLEELAAAESAGATAEKEASASNPEEGKRDTAGETLASKSGVGKSDVGKSGPVSGSKIGQGSGVGSAKDSNIFVFLCPNGHKLNGPPSLKGRPGQCPHCGARFVIPEDDIPEDDIPTGSAEDEEDIPAGEAVEDESAPSADEEIIEAEVEEVEPDPEPIPPGVHALGYIVGRLWDHKSELTELEIFLKEGEIVSPDHYAEILSTGEYGVFAHKEGDENYSLSVIPWAAVRRVDLRRVTKLREGTFR
jgi:predicted  nucleic acid-binding Zn-ribbon protein